MFVDNFLLRRFGFWCWFLRMGSFILWSGSLFCMDFCSGFGCLNLGVFFLRLIRVVRARNIGRWIWETPPLPLWL